MSIANDLSGKLSIVCTNCGNQVAQWVEGDEGGIKATCVCGGIIDVPASDIEIFRNAKLSAAEALKKQLGGIKGFRPS